MKRKTEEPLWKTAPISCTCEHWIAYNQPCGRPTDLAYPAMGGGWMALCMAHGQKHIKHGGAKPIEVLIMDGEAFK